MAWPGEIARVERLKSCYTTRECARKGCAAKIGRER